MFKDFTTFYQIFYQFYYIRIKLLVTQFTVSGYDGNLCTY